MFSKYDTLIFDMDGTLFDTEPLHRRAWISAFSTERIEVKEEEFIKHNGSAPWMVAKNVIGNKGLTLDPIIMSTKKEL